MKNYIFQSIRLTVLLIILLCIIYPVFISFAGKLTAGQGNGEKLMLNGKVAGYAAIGQKFDKPQYFWSRPSAVSYNAAGSAGSNKGSGNADYLKEVSNRMDTLLKYHPGLKKSEIPADLITASGSGLDPNISPDAARIQIKRIATVRKLNEKQVAALVEANRQKPLMGLFGPSSINVLKLNIALDMLTQ